MAKQKTPATNTEQVVENTVESTIAVVEESVASAPVEKETKNEIKQADKVKELKLISSKNVPLYKIASKQRNMEVGTIVAGHTYPYKDKTRNTEGIFYNIGKGFVYADDCVKIQ